MTAERAPTPAATIAVAAGKGGTGKTLVATSIAVSLAAAGQAVQLLDCDVEEPNADLLLQPTIGRRQDVNVTAPVVDVGLCTGCGRCAEACEFSAIAVLRGNVVTFADLCSGCGVCAYVCPAGAITEVARRVGTIEEGRTDDGVDFRQGRMEVGNLRAGPVIRAVKDGIDEATITIVDAPPGTSCPMQETVAGCDFCLLVTEPTPFGLSDLGAAVDTCRALSVPCAVILNRAGEDDEVVARRVAEMGVELILRIPQERRIAEAYSRGETLARVFEEWRAKLREVVEVVSCQVAWGR